MLIIKPSFTILDRPPFASKEEDSDEVYSIIERAGRTAYRSEAKRTPHSAEEFVRSLVQRGHESVLEHVAVSVKIVCDRGVSHELVRHRIASYTQESTRYCNYGNDGQLAFIKPCFFPSVPVGKFEKEDFKKWTISESPAPDICALVWLEQMYQAEQAYLKIIAWGSTPQEARSVLPNSLKTELIMSANLREWRHFFKLRCPKVAHPQMREISIPLLHEFNIWLPAVFGDITGVEKEFV